jgi:hypothetical protein
VNAATGLGHRWARVARARGALRALLALALALPAGQADAQRGGGGRDRERVNLDELPPNVPYDGRYIFVRIQYDMSAFGGGRGIGRGGAPWAHDYPRGERHFTTMLDELSTVSVRKDASLVLTLDDPELTKYPIAYMAEAGCWQPSEAEVLGMRNYLMKGGFFIFDDFQGPHWFNFASQLQRVLPEHKLIRLDVKHPIFDSFYRIETLETSAPVYGAQPEYYGIFEGNDPTKRLMVIVNYNQDLSEYWEWSDMGYVPIELSNEAYKLGINYIVYALSR